MMEKSETITGNVYNVVCNTRFYQMWYNTMRDYLASMTLAGTWMYSKAANGLIDVGAKNFHSYNYLGNQITFQVDKSLDYEYPDRAWAMCLDLTADKTTNQPAIAMFTLKNQEFITNWMAGPGGKDGMSSGEVSTAVAGARTMVWGLN